MRHSHKDQHPTIITLSDHKADKAASALIVTTCSSYPRKQEGDSSEWDEVEKELGSTQKQAVDSKQSRGLQYQLKQYLSPVFVEALALTFIAEWGDRSQVAFL